MSSQGVTTDMDFMWLYSLCQCILAVAVIVVSVRLCLALSSTSALAENQEGTQAGQCRAGSVSCCLRLCLGWVGAVGGAVKVPATVLVNLRTPQCLYTCITLVCFPLLVRQFTMFLIILITVDIHLHYHLANRYSSIVTRRRALCVVLLCWVVSVLSSFAQFISANVLDNWKNGGPGPSTTGLEVDGNWTTSLPLPTTSPLWYHDARKVIGKYLPYGGFLSKFYVEDIQNFTYAEIHSSHWVVCSPDTVLTPTFLVYVHGMTGFMLPFLCLLAIYLDVLCRKHRRTPFSQTDPSKQDSCHFCNLTLSLSLLVLLCLPIHIIHVLLLFAPSINPPAWAHAVAMFLFQLYSLVPQILFTPSWKKVGEEQTFPLSVPNLPPVVAGMSKGKSVSLALCEAVQAAPWLSAKQSLKAKVCPDV